MLQASRAAPAASGLVLFDASALLGGNAVEIRLRCVLHLRGERAEIGFVDLDHTFGVRHDVPADRVVEGVRLHANRDAAPFARIDPEP